MSFKQRKNWAFTPISYSMTALLQFLLDKKLITLKEPQPPPTNLPKNYRANQHCGHHQMSRHPTDRCYDLKHIVQDLLETERICFAPGSIDISYSALRLLLSLCPSSSATGYSRRTLQEGMASSVWTSHLHVASRYPSKSSQSRCGFSFPDYHLHRRRNFHLLVGDRLSRRPRDSSRHNGVFCYSDETGKKPPETTGIQLYSEIERLITETAKQSQDGLDVSGDWSEIEGAWVLKPRNTRPTSVVHFIGGIFVGAAPQLTYRLFLERLSEKGILVIATPYASGFDHFLIADEVQFKFDRCLRFLQETVYDLPTFGVGHSLGSVIHLLIGSRYAVQRNGNVLMAFNNKEASIAIPLFSPVIVPMAQSFGPFLSQLTSSPTIRLGAEMALKQLGNLSPPIMKQVLPLVEQLPPLYMDLVKGREDFTPKPEETRRLIKSYYGISRNLLIKFKDDTIDETSTLAQFLSADSAISSQLDMSIRSLPGDHGLPLQQALPDVPPGMADAVNRGGELLANLTLGTPWETVGRDVSNTLGVDSRILRAEILKDVNLLVDVITSWTISNTGPRLLRS
ncbi:hypothetical protein HHK36_007699 [Tetracentron sinense]|uniref:Uncharacterized protein n=1 Tax=Tetracentron sinense TaxID=13715 RepID=A0A835DLI9_TETSI|nr:hypothetical protein HHK36_007699 [Tetracentron sinense]